MHSLALPRITSSYFPQNKQEPILRCFVTFDCINSWVKSCSAQQQYSSTCEQAMFRTVLFCMEHLINNSECDALCSHAHKIASKRGPTCVYGHYSLPFLCFFKQQSCLLLRLCYDHHVVIVAMSYTVQSSHLSYLTCCTAMCANLWLQLLMQTTEMVWVWNGCVCMCVERGLSGLSTQVVGHANLQ